MSDPALPPHRNGVSFSPRLSFVPNSAPSLLSLCQTITADGRLAPEEIEGLRDWLADTEEVRPSGDQLSA